MISKNKSIVFEVLVYVLPIIHAAFDGQTKKLNEGSANAVCLFSFVILKVGRTDARRSRLIRNL